MTPHIEKELLKTTNNVTALGAFLAVGVTCVGSLALGMSFSFNAFVMTLVSAPFVIDGLMARRTLRGKNKHSPLNIDGIISGNYYKYKLTTLIGNYIEETKDAVEKKYKLIFLHLWFKSGRISLYDCQGDIRGVLERASQELIKNKETELPIDALFYSTKSIRYGKGIVRANNFFKEDEGDSKKFEVAKKVYSEFQEMGFAAKALIGGKEDFEFLMKLQDFKFTETDTRLIKESLKKDPKNSEGSQVAKFCISDSTLWKTINNEDSLVNLKILQQFFEDAFFKNNKNYVIGRLKEISPDVYNQIQVKSSYLSLSKDLSDEVSPGSEIKTARKKTKI